MDTPQVLRRQGDVNKLSNAEKLSETEETFSGEGASILARPLAG
jgi:hypothetical protein